MNRPICPICRAETSAKYRPFCSRRCADIDLGKWMTGSYGIPSEEPPEDEDFIAAQEADTSDKPH